MDCGAGVVELVFANPAMTLSPHAQGGSAAVHPLNAGQRSRAGAWRRTLLAVLIGSAVVTSANALTLSYARLPMQIGTGLPLAVVFLALPKA